MIKRFAAAAVLVTALLSLPNADARDLDIGSPAGSPLDWEKDLNNPIPTGRATPPIATGKAGEKPPAPPAKTDPKSDPEKKPAPGQTDVTKPKAPPEGTETTPRPKTPADFNYSVKNWGEYIQILTMDIWGHFKVTVPPGGTTRKPVSEDPPKDIDTGSGNTPTGNVPGAIGGGIGGADIVIWRYPPDMPAEQVLTGVAIALRSALHPEAHSTPEAIANLVRLGEAATHGAAETHKAVPGPVGGVVAPIVGAIPAAAPDFIAGTTPLETMLNKLAVVELTGGFPYSLDPNYCKRLLGFDEQAAPAVVACADSAHTFLSRNAVTLLSGYRDPKAREKLREIAKSGADPVKTLRAMTGLITTNDDEAVDILITKMADKDQYIQSFAIYGLGILKNPKAVQPIVDFTNRTSDPDMLWACLAALARLHDNRKEVIDLLNKKEKEIAAMAGQAPPGPPPPQGRPAGLAPATPVIPALKFKILEDLLLLARASCNQKAAVDVVLGKVAADGLKSFTIATYYVVLDVLPHIGTKGKAALKAIVGVREIERAVHLHAVRQFAKAGASASDLKALTLPAYPAYVRAQALLLLADVDKPGAVKAAQVVLSAVGNMDAAEAILLGTAIQILGQAKALNAPALAKIVTAAFEGNAYGRKEGTNNIEDLLAGMVTFPPFLEIAVIELGKTGNAVGIPPLAKIIKTSKGPGKAEAALALGAIGAAVPEKRKEVVALLILVIDDGDGWTRYCAYQALKRISEQDHFCDWIFGSAATRGACADKYKSWAASIP